MILTLFAVLMAISLILIAVGYHYDATVLQVVGYGFIFIVCSVTLVDGIQYHSGDVINKSGNDTVVTEQYATYPARYISFFLCVVGVAGASLSLFEYRKEARNE